MRNQVRFNPDATVGTRSSLLMKQRRSERSEDLWDSASTSSTDVT